MFSTLNRYFGITKPAFANTASLMSSTFLSKIIFSLGGIFLANIYGPTDYGLYNVFLGYAGICSVAFLLSSNRILLSSDSYKEIRQLFSSQILLSFLFCLFVCLCLLGLKNFLVSTSGLGIGYLILSVVCGLFLSYISLINAFYNKYTFYKIISTGVVLFSLSIVFFQIAAHYINLPNGLIFAYLPGLVFTVFYLSKKASNAFEKPSLKVLYRIFSKYKDILVYSFPASVLFSLSQSVLPILILEYFGAKEAGEFSLAWKITMLPILIVSMSLNSIYSQKATKIYFGDRSQIFGYTLKISAINFLLLLFSLFLLNSVGIYLIDQTFSKDWAQLTSHFFLLSIFFLLRGLQVVTEHIFVVSNRNKQLLVFYVLLIFAYIVSIFYGHQSHSFVNFLRLFSLVCGCLHAVFFLYSLYITFRLKKEYSCGN